VIDVDKHVAYWRNGAVDDWDVARHLVDSGKLRHGLFFGHLAMEKALKAVVCSATAEVPPRIHDLIRLAGLAGLALDSKQAAVVAEFNSFNLFGRYPDMASPLPPVAAAAELMGDGHEVLAWLLNR